MNLTCATYNILHGYHSDLIVKNIRFLIKEGADVICLQEAETTFEPVLKQLLAEKDLSNWRMEIAHAGRGADVATLWNTEKLQLVDTEVVQLPQLRRPSTLQMIGGLREPSNRAGLIAHFKFGEHVLQVSNAHLAWEGGARHRFKQLSHLRETMLSRSADLRIVTGDFNTVATRLRRGASEKRVEKTLGAEFRNAFPKLPWSYDISFCHPDDALQFIATLSRAGIKWRQRFDYMFASDMTVMAAKMHDLPGSDHRPLIATFGLSAGEEVLP